MNTEQIHSYVKQFFVENESEILEESPSYLHIQLSIDMDKALMNRPFYWHYLEKMGGVPNPMKLTLITDQNNAPEGLKGEALHFGAPRLHQIFETAIEQGSHALLYESIQVNKPSIGLNPWLVLNVIVSYCCDRTKEQLFSIGLNLITGEMISDFHSLMKNKDFQEAIPDYCYTINPIIKPKSGIERIKKQILLTLEKENHAWAYEAAQRWQEDERLLEAFYEEYDEKPSTYEMEKEALKQQYEPLVKINIINGGLFYFANHPLT
ncbi:YqhG family protein [Bacillus shivajii]|uniref:YqhG family protein n=1 Tax=Bacillus shivajii TaxID=1983719 RepID=UPI001CFBEC17|nr:YqhG family protein [Bacillus shivajii]UCZ54579.1 YqhG family protein [Bacillus shivajii]